MSGPNVERASLRITLELVLGMILPVRSRDHPIVSIRSRGPGNAHPPQRQPRGKWMITLVNFHTNATSKRWHLWEIRLKIFPRATPGWHPIASAAMASAADATTNLSPQPQPLGACQPPYPATHAHTPPESTVSDFRFLGENSCFSQWNLRARSVDLSRL